MTLLSLVAWLPAHAQVTTDSARQAAARDSAVAKAVQDSIRDARNVLAQARIDSIVRAKAADTIKAPLAHFEVPPLAEVTDRLRFNREAILSSGAVNLADILDRVPGVTTFRSGWLAGLHAAAFNSDFKRIRIFYDGVERDAIEPRNGGVLDLSDIPIWTLDEIVIERVPGEIRVWLRGLTVQRTTPFTRVDVFTGDLNTNGFRALFARRFANGVALQFIGQQAATQSVRVSGFNEPSGPGGRSDGDTKFVDLRIGWARGLFTVDVAGIGLARDRDPYAARTGFSNLPEFTGARREAYARVAYGDSLRGPWAQALVNVLRTRLEGIAAAVPDTSASTDTIRGRTQQMLAVGYRGTGWHASLLNRARPVNGTLYNAPALRLGVGNAQYRLEGYAEQRDLDSLRVVDIQGIARPLPWLALVAAHSSRTPNGDTERLPLAATRAEVAVRYRKLWLGGGVVRESDVTYDSPVILGAPDALLSAQAATGLLTSVRGMLYKDVRLDVQAVRWGAAHFSRPLTSVRTELALISPWLSRFPKGQFGINARLAHEWRGAVPFFWTVAGDNTQRDAQPSQVVTGLLEIRIQNATLFYQYRNLTGRQYEQIPGINMPFAVQMYGVRWEFWN